MAIKFALKMGGENVRTMEELRAAFAALEAVEYVENGKLVKWLKNHDEDALAQQVEALDPEDDAMPRKLCKLIGVPYDEAAYQAALEAKDQDAVVVEEPKKVEEEKLPTKTEEDNVELVDAEPEFEFPIIIDRGARIIEYNYIPDPTLDVYGNFSRRVRYDNAWAKAIDALSDTPR